MRLKALAVGSATNVFVRLRPQLDALTDWHENIGSCVICPVPHNRLQKSTLSPREMPFRWLQMVFFAQGIKVFGLFFKHALDKSNLEPASSVPFCCWM